MINAGAITVSSMLAGHSPQEKVTKILQFLEQIIGKQLSINEEVFQSEWQTANRNRALAYYLMDSGFLDCSVDAALEVYLKQCAIEVNVSDLAMIGLVIANDGYHPLLKKQLFPKQVAKLAKALMVTCGMYNASGKFAAFIGLPQKWCIRCDSCRCSRPCKPELPVSYWLWYRNLRTSDRSNRKQCGRCTVAETSSNRMGYDNILISEDDFSALSEVIFFSFCK